MRPTNRDRSPRCPRRPSGLRRRHWPRRRPSRSPARRRCSAATICTFCSGLTRAKTCTSAASFGASVLVEGGEFGTGHLSCIRRQPQLMGDRPCGYRVVAGDQHHPASGIHQRLDQRPRRCSCGVGQTDVADQLEVVRGGVDGVGIGVVLASVPCSQRRCATANTRRPCSARRNTNDSAWSWSAISGSANRQRGRISSGAPLSYQHRLRRVSARGADRGGIATTGLERYLREHGPLRIPLVVNGIGCSEDCLVGGVRMSLPVMGLGAAARGGPQHLRRPSGRSPWGTDPPHRPRAARHTPRADGFR